MRSIGGNPHCAERRHDPNALLRAQRHHSARSKQQLVFRMGVLGDHVTVSEVSRYAGYLGNQSPGGSTEYALALVRHFLSHYREKTQGATAIFERLNANQSSQVIRKRPVRYLKGARKV